MTKKKYYQNQGTLNLIQIFIYILDYSEKAPSPPLPRIGANAQVVATKEKHDPLVSHFDANLPKKKDPLFLKLKSTVDAPTDRAI